MGSIHKGKRTERELARRLSEVFPEAKRSYEERSGNNGDLVGTKPFVFELKSGAKPSIYQAYEQACEAAGDDEIPVGTVFFDRSSRQDPRNGRKALRGVLVGLDDFIEMLEQLD